MFAVWMAVLVCTFISTSAFAQASRTASLVVTAADPSGAVIPNASVTLVGLEDATKLSVVPAATTSDKGVATFSSIAPGRYEIHAAFPGFEPGLLKDVRLRIGENKQLVILAIQKVETEVTVGREKQAVAADPRGQFGSAMTREQIEALSDDPAEMQKQLQDMAGPDAILRVDSFEGGQLPPKSQIKAIHITRDAFAAENHSAGGLFIDIITQPGVGALRGGVNVRLRDGSTNARNPFAPLKGPERMQNYGFYTGGSLLKEKSSFSLSVNGQTAFDTPYSYVVVPGGGGPVSKLLGRRPNDNLFVNGLIDYAVTRDQTLRVSVSRSRFTSRNLGIGGYDEAERAYSTENDSTFVRIQEAGPLGRRLFTNTRLQIGRTNSASSSLVEALTYRSDFLNTGGAQIKGGRKATVFNLQSDLDYVRGIQSVRMGINVDGGSYRSDDSSNYLGTYYFVSPEALQAGQPSSFTKRIGDPNIAYQNVQAGIYIQDDIRVRKSLTLSPGLRYELQTHLSDYSNLGPRIGITWAPFKNGKTSVRASWGVFYDWLNANTYEQTLRVDGFRQQELNIADPSFPDPGDIGSKSATNRYLLTDGLPMVRNTRVSLGVDETISPRVRLGVLYADTRGSGLLRGNNLNPPLNGIRPDPAFVNIVEVAADAASRQHTISANANVSLAAPSPALNGPNSPRINWKRTSFNVNYSAGRFENNTDGAFSLPASGSPAGEWGEVAGEVRHHRINLGINAGVVKNLNVNLNVFATTGTPYTMTTGDDDNGDLVFNDRPAGVGRNTLWTPGQWSLNSYLSYTIAIGKRTVAPPGGITGISIMNGVANVMTGGPAPPRYRISFNVSAQNLTNNVNYTGFSGMIRSPLYGRATGALNPRKVDFGLNLSF